MQNPKVTQVGATTTSSGSSSAAIALPTMAGGVAARYVLVTASTLGYIKFGGAACTANDILVTSFGRVFDVAGVGFYTVLQETASCKINVVAVDT